MTDYDDVPYPAGARPQTHPDRLATHACLFGLNPPDTATARVLEIGCSDGGNLIPMAFALPGGSFTGIDLAETAIEKGRRLIGRLGLTNIRLLPLDLMDAGQNLGQFDYIISHGVYSWVPEAVRDRLLGAIGELLSPAGVAYVSYNVYPGGYLPRMLREMLLYHVRGEDGAKDRLRAAAELLAFLSGSLDTDEGFPSLLREEVKRLRANQPYQVLHNELAANYQPVYFHQFASHARSHGLEYLAEADPRALIGPAVAVTGADRVEREQYADFLVGCRFRQTLLRRAANSAAEEPDWHAIRSLYVAAEVRTPAAQPALGPGIQRQFQIRAHARSGNATTDDPLAKAGLVELGEAWPASIFFTDLATRAAVRIGAELQAEEEERLAKFLLSLYTAGILDLSVTPHRFAAKAGLRPEVSAVARAQLEEQEEVTNLRHAMVRIEDDLSRALVLFLDGSRDRDALLRGLRERNAETTPEGVEAALKSLADSALLTA